MGDSLCCAGLSTCCQHGGYPWRAFVNETENWTHRRDKADDPLAQLPPSSRRSPTAFESGIRLPDTLTPRKLQPLKEIMDAGANCCPVHSVDAT